jgi:hypothetical protein
MSLQPGSTLFYLQSLWNPPYDTIKIKYGNGYTFVAKVGRHVTEKKYVTNIGSFKDNVVASILSGNLKRESYMRSIQ